MADPKDEICFVIGPIGGEGTDERRHADWLLKGIIRPVFERNRQLERLTVKRADEEQAPGSINSQVINRLWDATLVIADMSFLNANAFYELGIAHMRRRPTIHMIHKDSQIPFDQVPYRAIEFAIKDVDDIDNAQQQLESAAIEALKEGFQVENPVTHARGFFELAERADEPTKVLASELASSGGRWIRCKGKSETCATARLALAYIRTPEPPVEQLGSEGPEISGQDSCQDSYPSQTTMKRETSSESSSNVTRLAWESGPQLRARIELYPRPAIAPGFFVASNPRWGERDRTQRSTPPKKKRTDMSELEDMHETEDIASDDIESEDIEAIETKARRFRRKTDGRAPAV